MTTPNFKKRTTVFLGAQSREKPVDSYKCLPQEVPCIFLQRNALWPGFDTFYFPVKLQRAFLISQESVAPGLQPNPAAYQPHGRGRSKPQLLPCEMGVGGKISVAPFFEKSQSNNWWNLFISCQLLSRWRKLYYFWQPVMPYEGKRTHNNDFTAQHLSHNQYCLTKVSQKFTRNFLWSSDNETRREWFSNKRAKISSWLENDKAFYMTANLYGPLF